MKVCVYTIGCKVNQYESDGIIRALKERGFDVCSDMEAADAYIINTCAVTAEAERKSRQCVSRVRKLNPEAPVYITGCASERDPAQFQDKEGVASVSGTAGKSRLKFFEELTGMKLMDIPKAYEDDLQPLSLRTRSYIKAQDGCDNFCSYCILPYVRGRSRSRSIESVTEECREAARNCLEAVLTGINLSAYGKDISSSLKDLIRSIAGILPRLRLGSLEANVIDRELLELLKGMPEFCPHFHLSLQSGDDKILKDMNRRYTAGEYLDKVELIYLYFPEAAITTDIIAGYPTENEENFRNTIKLAEAARFADIHCFPYSRREGTKAASLKPLPAAIVEDRMKRLEELKAKLIGAYNQRFIGIPLKVLFEECSDGECQGYSENYIRVYSDGCKKLKTLTAIVPKQIYKDGLKG